MMDSGKKKTLEKAFERIINVGFCLTPYEDLSDIISSDPVVFGTTIDEKILSVEGVDELFKSQFEQMGSLVPELDRDRIATHISPDEKSAFIVEEFTLLLSSPDDVSKIFIRASCVMDYIDNGWKLTHWHASTPVETENDHWHMEEWKREKEKLQKLVDEQTVDLQSKNRELEIEAAIERVRARTMAMHNSDELGDVASVLFEQISSLTSAPDRFNIGIANEKDKTLHIWLTDQDGHEITKKFIAETSGSPVVAELFQDWEKKKNHSILDLYGKKLENWVRYMGGEVGVPFSKDSVKDHRFISSVFFSHGFIGITTHEEPDFETIQLLERFSNVFEQTYIRFLDLKKAEAQAREAQLEAALERVRSRSMGMQSSEELADVAFVLFEELRGLGGNLWGTGFGLCDKGSEADDFWFANENGVFPPVSIPNTVDPAHKKMYEGWENEMEFLALEGSGEDLKNHYNYMMTLPGVRPFFQKILDEGLSFPEWQQWNAAYFSHGYLLIITLEPYPDKEILKRFTRVFDQTYTRFLDLNKAEAQARESEIQLALERVRAKSMAMHQSDELADLSLELVKQVQSLGIDTWFCAFNIYDDHPEGSIEWGSNGQGTFPRYRTPREGVFLDYYEAGQRGEALLINEISEEECPAHYEYLCSLPGVGEQLLQMKDEGIPFPTFQIDHVAFFKYGYILFITFEPAPEAHDIFKRFAKVFQQTYTRFLDLKKAEAQAREAKIEAALERVRARSMGMHKSDDLIDVVREIGKGIHELGIQLHYSQIYTDYTYDPKTGLNIWVDVEGQDYLEKFHLPYIDHSITLNYYNALNEGLDYFSDRYSKTEKDTFFKLLFKYSDLKRIPKKRKELILNASGWTRFTVILNEATLNFGRYSLDEFTDEEHKIFIRFAKVFGQAYTRFLDLKKAEEQVREAEVQLALERVRAKTMAMKTQSDLFGVVEMFGEQLKAVGVRFDDVTFIDGPITKNRDWELWSHVPGVNGFTRKVHIPYVETPYFTKTAKAVEEYEKTGNPIQVKSFSKNEKDKFLDHYFKHAPAIPDEVMGLVYENPGSVIVDAFLKEVTVSLVRWDLETFTEEELEIFERFSKEFRQTYIRFQDLQKAERQAREAEIEAALERVRSRSLAMHKPDELQDVVRVVAEELKNTGVILDTGGAVICTYFQDSKDVIHWTATDDPAHPSVPYLLPYFEDELFDEAWASKIKGDDYFAKEFSYEVKNAFFNHVFEHSDYRQLPDEYKTIILESKSHGLAWAWSENSAIMIPSIQGDLPSEEEKKILIRFAKVFEQSFIRFLDLQKAEEQAREAQIEAALERVRTKGMAMQSTDDIESATAVVFNELSKLGIEMERCGITLMNETQIAELWSTTLSQDNREVVDIVTGYLDFRIHPILQQSHRDWIEQKNFSDYKLVGDEVREYYNKLEKQPKYKFPKVDQYPEQQVLQSFFFKEGGIFVFTKTELSAEAKNILRRFTKVFEQTYTRFLDLKKAEEQAREAQIEAALERIRSRSMAMQRSDELSEVVRVVYDEVEKLEISNWGCALMIFDDINNHIRMWFSEIAINDQVRPYDFDNQNHELVRKWWEFWKSDDEFLNIHLSDEENEEWVSYLFEDTGMKNLPNEVKEFIRSNKEIYFTYAKIKQGLVSFIDLEPFSKDIYPLLKRIARTFEQAYTRFLDVQRAEKLALETARQSSLDRIRAEIGSMRNTEDLQQITPIIWDELKTLEIPFIRCGVFIIDEENGISHTYLSTSQGDPIAALHLPLEDIPLVKNAVSSWKEKKVYTEHWDEEDFRDWTQNLIDRGFIQSKKKYEAGSAPETLDLHFLPFKHGMLYIGNTEPLSQEKLDLGQSMAKAFSVAYDRYEDFNKLEQAKQKIEEAFRELEAAKDQLVQQEKLASLGQLTAGIAHEIKNPLNFVNNFSDLSVELVQETKEELSGISGHLSAEDRKKVDEALEILKDIEANLEKIHEHGTRADGIVKSMLQHSRGSSGKMEPTDLNALIKEYANLAFHGMRAGKDPINVDIELELDENVGEVKMIGEDFSRVILNLCNNAFDAMREKLSADTPQLSQNPNGSYQPKLTIKTFQNDTSIAIEIHDNGPGIPDEIKDKILQPFFTTKKGTAGTGLGLSITNDIIKAHGGSISIESKKDQFTRCTIHLNN